MTKLKHKEPCNYKAAAAHIMNMALSSHGLVSLVASNTTQNSSTTTAKPSLPRAVLHVPSPLTTSQFPLTFTNNSVDVSFSNFPTVAEKWKAKVSFFPVFLNKAKTAETLKRELLDLISQLDRGSDATPEDQERVDQIARKLEAVNPTKEPLKYDLLNGKWELIYTTSRSILQIQRPKFLRSVTNYQAINVDTLRAQNMESWPFFNQVTTNLTPLNAKKVAVQFDYFKIAGLLPIKAPETARGELEINYVDEELRVSRGDKGNLFILKMVDPSYRVPVKQCKDEAANKLRNHLLSHV